MGVGKERRHSRQGGLRRFGAADSARPFRRGRSGAETIRRCRFGAETIRRCRFGAETIRRRGIVGARSFRRVVFILFLYFF